jgi:hypothetical protein
MPSKSGSSHVHQDVAIVERVCLVRPVRRIPAAKNGASERRGALLSHRIEPDGGNVERRCAERLFTRCRRLPIRQVRRETPYRARH